MQQKQHLSQIILRIASFGFGLISILGGIVALGHAEEPERYLVSAIIMIAGGVLWITCSLLRTFSLTRKQYTVILAIILAGLLIGLSSTFLGCGGECGGSFCHWYLGYPGRWLRISNCMAGSTGTIWWQWITKGTWQLDAASLVADFVFWGGVGLVILFLWKIVPFRNSAAINT